jgi:hypothetical protein
MKLGYVTLSSIHLIAQRGYALPDSGRRSSVYIVRLNVVVGCCNRSLTRAFILTILYRRPCKNPRNIPGSDIDVLLLCEVDLYSGNFHQYVPTSASGPAFIKALTSCRLHTAVGN